MGDSSSSRSHKIAKRGLGRGLGSLISAGPVALAEDAHTEDSHYSPVEDSENKPTPSTGSEGGSGVRYLLTEQLVPSENQPRQDFRAEELVQLAESIRALGVIQPVLVRPKEAGTDQFEIIAGERRWRAAQQAQLSKIPVIVRDIDDRSALEIALVENVQRSDLNPIEVAKALQSLIDRFSYSQQEIAERVGKDRASVSNYIRLLKLPDEVQQRITTGRLSMGHAKAILTVREPSVQIRLAKKCEEEQLSVRDLEAIVGRVVVLDGGKLKSAKTKNAVGLHKSDRSDFPEVVERLRRALGTKVRVRHHHSGRGKIEIEYFSEQELDRLVEGICAHR